MTGHRVRRPSGYSRRMTVRTFPMRTRIGSSTRPAVALDMRIVGSGLHPSGTQMVKSYTMIRRCRRHTLCSLLAMETYIAWRVAPNFARTSTSARGRPARSLGASQWPWSNGDIPAKSRGQNRAACGVRPRGGGVSSGSFQAHLPRPCSTVPFDGIRPSKMARILFRCWLLLLLGSCGTGQPSVRPPDSERTGGASPRRWPSLCHRIDESDCWRAHFPVEACADPVHPELVGLWGADERWTPSNSEDPDFTPRLVWDGCYATVWVDRHTIEDLGVESLADLQRPSAATLPVHRHYDRAHRLHVAWRGDAMFADSDLTDDFPIARPWTAPDGSVHWAAIRGERFVVLRRFAPPDCLDRVGYDLLCARDILPPRQRE